MDSIVSSIKRAIKKGDIKSKIFCLILINLGYSNSRLQTLEIRNKNFRYIKRKYRKSIDEICSKYISHEDANKNNYNDGRDNIWICWFQGIENSPEIVKKCVESVKYFMHKKNIKIISNKNIKEYVQFPEWIEEKRRKGIITDAHYSDLLRLELLIRYGGTWIDATTYLTGSIPELFFKKDLFMYNHSFPDDITNNYNNWLISAKKNNIILKEIRDLLYEYWKKENKVREYFLWHLFTTIVMEKHPLQQREIYNFTDEIPEILRQNIFSQFDEDYWNELKKVTSIHKLTYKLDMPSNIAGTYYEYIIKNKFEEQIGYE